MKKTLFFLFLFLSATAAGAAWEPRGWRRSETKAPTLQTNPAAMVLTWAVKAYQRTISQVDGDRCPSYPTCSAYAVEALKEHGPFLGSVLTAGRLLSEADEAAFAPRIFIKGKWKIYSPVKGDLLFLSNDEAQ